MSYVKTISKATRIWVEVYKGDEKFLVTSNKDRSVYSIYKVRDFGYDKLGSGKNPFELEEKYIWKE